jgi:hypothetical protein
MSKSSYKRESPQRKYLLLLSNSKNKNINFDSIIKITTKASNFEQLESIINS